MMCAQADFTPKKTRTKMKITFYHLCKFGLIISNSNNDFCKYREGRNK